MEHLDHGRANDGSLVPGTHPCKRFVLASAKASTSFAPGVVWARAGAGTLGQARRGDRCPGRGVAMVTGRRGLRSLGAGSRVAGGELQRTWRAIKDPNLAGSSRAARKRAHRPVARDRPLLARQGARINGRPGGCGASVSISLERESAVPGAASSFGLRCSSGTRELSGADRCVLGCFQTERKSKNFTKWPLKSSSLCLRGLTRFNRQNCLFFVLPGTGPTTGRNASRGRERLMRFNKQIHLHVYCAGLSLLVLLVVTNGVRAQASKTPRNTAGAQATSGKCARTISANVAALDQPYMLNRLGAAMPQGMIFALTEDVYNQSCSDPANPACKPCSDPTANCKSGQVMLRSDKRPRPIVLRMNVGD